MKKFEYKTFNEFLTDRELNLLGEKGWELILHSSVYVSREHKIKQVYFFKREL